MAVNSRQKGSSYERAIAKLFEEWSGSSVKRTPLSGGWAKEAAFEAKSDLVSTDKKFPFAVECKKREGWVLEHILYTKTEIFSWWEQTVKETPEGKIPLLVFSKNRSKNFAMLSIEGWRKIAPTRRPKGKWMMVKTKKTGLCYILILSDFLKQIPYPQKKGKK